MEKLKIGIINSTVRSKRRSDKISDWILERAKEYGEYEYEVVDLQDYPMSLNVYGEKDQYAMRFNEKLSSFDGFIFITAEYNHSIPGAFKNALDWTAMDTGGNKPAAIVSYGAIGGARAAEHLRGILSGLNMAHIYRQLLINIFTDFDKDKNFAPADFQYKAFEELLNQLELWAKAFKSIR